MRHRGRERIAADGGAGTFDRGRRRRIEAADERRGAARGPAAGRRGRVQDAGGRARPVPDAAGPDARAEPGDRRGGRAGHLARGAERDRPLRGALLAADLDRQHPAQHRAHAAAGASGGCCRSPFSRAAGRRVATSRRWTPTASSRSASRSPARGRARPPSGPRPRSASAPRKPAESCWRRSPSCRRPPARGDRPARHQRLVGRGGAQRTWGSARPTNECCCTGRDPRCARRWRSYFEEEDRVE